MRRKSFAGRGLCDCLRKVRGAFLAALCLLHGPSLLAYSNVEFDHLSLEHGLAQSSIQDMVSDPLGYMWFGTQYGLSRYDGYGFRNFRHEPGDLRSLSNSRIQSLLCGQDGTIWVGTPAGLNRIDPRTLRLERVPLEGSEMGDPTQPQPNILEIAEGRHGNLLIQARSGPLFFEYRTGRLRRVAFDSTVAVDAPGTVAADGSGRLWLYNNQGLWRLDRNGSVLRRVLEVSQDDAVIRHGSLAIMPSGLLALAGEDGVTFFDPAWEVVVERLRPSERGHDSDRVASVAADPRGLLWLLAPGYLAQYDPGNDRWRVHLDRRQYGASEARQVYDLAVIRDGRGFVWIGLPEGVGLSSPGDRAFRLLQHDPKEPDSLTASPWSSTYSVYEDAFGVVWVGGGLGGLSRFAPQRARFEHIIDVRKNELFGTDNVVRAVLEVENDGREYLWTGLSFSGLRVWRREGGSFNRIVAELHSLAEPGSRLPDNHIWALAAHPAGRDVWVGTNAGLIAVSIDDFTVRERVPVLVDGRPVRVRAMIFSDDGRRLWVAGGRRLITFELGPEGRKATRVGVRPMTPAGGNEDQHGIFGMLRLEDGRLLVGTRQGLMLWNPETGEIAHTYPAGQAGALPRNFIFGLAQTEDGRVWIGTEQAGLARAELQDGGFGDWQWIDRENGLPDDTVYAILPTPSGRLWLSSNRGLARFNPESGVTRHFTLGDGLQALEFNNTVATVGDSGRFYFGGINGVNAFRPEAIELHEEPPRVFLQRAEVGGDPVTLDARSTARLQTRYDRNSLVAEFVGLHFVQPQRNRYAYRLSDVEEDWVYSQTARTVRYPDLPPGEYMFTVKAANSDGIWSEPRQLFSLHIAPPPWLTPWAYSLYVAVAAALLGLFLTAERRRRRRLELEVTQRTRELREQKELVDRQAHTLQEVLDTRTTLFANISHEFRTPLTLIEASIDRLVRNPHDSAATASARRYLRRLLRLVDQLLNLSRLQSLRERFLPDAWALDRVVAMTVDAFRPLAEQKGISLQLSGDGRWLTQCHQADIERILLNLIGNALKYCPAGAEVSVSLGDGEGGVLLSVADNGPGIDHEQQAQIFERFNRMPAHEQGRIEGAGIGLTLVREAARSNGGDVSVASEPGRGSVFSVWLPAWRGHMQGAPVDQLAHQRLQLELEALSADPSADAGSPGSEVGSAAEPGALGTALVVDDNADLRAHLADALFGDWSVLEAVDGADALKMARDRSPDVVISDIMMPRMDGLELLKRLRQDVRTSHLPVLLLTARQDDATRLEGFSLSADDFLAKPFDPSELRLRLRRMVDIRTRVQARLWRQLELSGHGARESSANAAQGDDLTPDISERDEQLLERVRSWLEANHDDPEAAVSDMAEFLAVEQRTLQRKLKALTGRTPAAHLQHFRLERARRMLTEGASSVQEIAFSCGFSSPQYFARVFARNEGVSPSKWREQARN